MTPDPQGCLWGVEWHQQKGCLQPHIPSTGGLNAHRGISKGVPCLWQGGQQRVLDPPYSCPKESPSVPGMSPASYLGWGGGSPGTVPQPHPSGRAVPRDDPSAPHLWWWSCVSGGPQECPPAKGRSSPQRHPRAREVPTAVPSPPAPAEGVLRAVLGLSPRPTATTQGVPRAVPGLSPGPQPLQRGIPSPTSLSEMGRGGVSRPPPRHPPS